MEFENLIKDPEHLERAQKFMRRIKNEVFPDFIADTVHLGASNMTDKAINASIYYEDQEFLKFIQNISDSADKDSADFYIVNVSAGSKRLAVIDEIYNKSDAISKDLDAEFVHKKQMVNLTRDNIWRAFKWYRFRAK